MRSSTSHLQFNTHAIRLNGVATMAHAPRKSFVTFAAKQMLKKNIIKNKPHSTDNSENGLGQTNALERRKTEQSNGCDWK